VGVIDLADGVFERHKEAFLANFDTLEKMVQKIDSALKELDDFMDALQPQGLSGKMRVAFVQNRDGSVPELRIMYRKKGNVGWFSKRVTRGWGSRSLKRTGLFEEHYETVKVICTTAEALIAERAHLMVRLRSVSSGFRESVKTASARVEKLDALYVQPFSRAFKVSAEKVPE
jgi:hypothetical protein